MAPSPHPEPTLLLVDDDENARFVYAEVLRGAGYRVLEAESGQQGLDLAAREKPSLILLDVDMPEFDGWQTLHALLSQPQRQPVVMLTGEVGIEDRVRGLGAGADDYLCKPCDAREFLARVHAVLRRSQPAEGPTMLVFGDAWVNLEERTAVRTGESLGLTRTEFALLEFLARHAGRPVPRTTLLEAVWGYTGGSSTRTLETHLWRLRGKLGDAAGDPRWIRTVAGSGYVLDRSVLAAGQPEPLPLSA